AKLAAWLEQQPQSRDWIASIGFKAEPGTFAFVPGRDGRPAAVLAARAEGTAVFAFADLPMALPEGKYVFQMDDPALRSSDAALGWALGSYAFTAYKKPKRAPATLVWPADADQAEVERISR